jgi:hypothetical protein
MEPDSYQVLANSDRKNILKKAQLGRSVYRKTRMSTNLIVLLTTVDLDRNFDPWVVM